MFIEEGPICAGGKAMDITSGKEHPWLIPRQVAHEEFPVALLFRRQLVHPYIVLHDLHEVMKSRDFARNLRQLNISYSKEVVKYSKLLWFKNKLHKIYGFGRFHVYFYLSEHFQFED